MLTDLKGVEVPEFGLALVVELEELLDEFRIVSSEFFTIFFEVENCTGLALHLVDVRVVDACDFVARLLSLSTLLVVAVSLFSLSR
jgi:ABC-type antimicrobial peptide transport system permease subunit